MQKGDWVRRSGGYSKATYEVLSFDRDGERMLIRELFHKIQSNKDDNVMVVWIKNYRKIDKKAVAAAFRKKIKDLQETLELIESLL